MHSPGRRHGNTGRDWVPGKGRRREERDVKLVELKRQVGDGSEDVVAAVGPMGDTEADAYASQLLQPAEQHPDLGFSVGTRGVESRGGEAADPPAGPAELLRAVLSGDAGTRDGDHDIPEPEPGD